MLEIMRRTLSSLFFSKIHTPNLYTRNIRILSNFLTKRRKKIHVQTWTKEREESPNNQLLVVGKKEWISTYLPHAKDP